MKYFLVLLSFFVLLSPAMPCHCEHAHHEQNAHELSESTDSQTETENTTTQKEASQCLEGLHCAIKMTFHPFHFIAFQSVDFIMVQLPHYQRLLPEVYLPRLLRPPSSYLI